MTKLRILTVAEHVMLVIENEAAGICISKLLEAESAYELAGSLYEAVMGLEAAKAAEATSDFETDLNVTGYKQ